jgi:DNA-binding Lrp family transcriptional regulator
MRSLDDIDLRILRLLQSNPRIPVSKLARGVGLTDNAIRYRIKRLQASGIIRGFATVLDARALGHTEAVILGQLAQPVELGELIQRAKAEKAGVSVACGFTCEGDQTVLLFVRGPSEQAVRDFSGVLQGLGVKDARVLMVREGYGLGPAGMPEAKPEGSRR